MRNEKKYLTKLTEFELEWILEQIQAFLANGYKGMDMTVYLVNFYQKLQEDKKYYDKLEEEKE